MFVKDIEPKSQKDIRQNLPAKYLDNYGRITQNGSFKPISQ
jgi:hypothetical protein